MAKIQRIVVARYRFIGDTLLTLPFLKALRTQHPQAVIHWLVGEDAFELVQHCPYADQVIRFEPRRLGFWNAVRFLKQENYDTAYILKRSFSSALMMRLANIPHRVGFDTDGRGFLLTEKIPYRPTEQHEAACFIDLLRHPTTLEPLNALDTGLSYTLPAPLGDALPPKTGPWILLHMTSTNPAKCWPQGHFAQVAQQLLHSYQTQLFFLGTPSEKPTYDALIKQLPPESHSSIFNYCGQTSLIDSMALIKQMDLVIANDSGMIHMAAAVDTPVVCLFGPSDPSQWHPLSQKYTIITHPSLSCRPCRLKITCHNTFPCLTEITPDMVLNACKPYMTC